MGAKTSFPHGFTFRFSLRPESSQEHLPISIAGVLRLRAIKPSVCDRSAKRFAQDDGFVGGPEIQLNEDRFPVAAPKVVFESCGLITRRKSCYRGPAVSAGTGEAT